MNQSTTVETAEAKPNCAPVPGSAPRPTIVTLCGSTMFKDAFAAANFRETLAGKIVLSIGCDANTDQELGLTEEIKARLDELHKRKIDLCDEILVLNVSGYIGKSTRSEIDYAIANEKRVRWLETQEQND